MNWLEAGVAADFGCFVGGGFVIVDGRLTAVRYSCYPGRAALRQRLQHLF